MSVPNNPRFGGIAWYRCTQLYTEVKGFLRYRSSLRKQLYRPWYRPAKRYLSTEFSAADEPLLAVLHMLRLWPVSCLRARMWVVGKLVGKHVGKFLYGDVRS